MNNEFTIKRLNPYLPLILILVVVIFYFGLNCLLDIGINIFTSFLIVLLILFGIVFFVRHITKISATIIFEEDRVIYKEKNKEIILEIKDIKEIIVMRGKSWHIISTYPYTEAYVHNRWNDELVVICKQRPRTSNYVKLKNNPACEDYIAFTYSNDMKSAMNEVWDKINEDESAMLV